MYSVWLKNDEQALWRNYLTMTAQLTAAMNRQLQQECGLSLADYDVLVALDEQRNCRINDLGDRLGWEQSRVSHQLRRMQSRGLLERHAASDDRRGATVELTTAGRDALTTAAPGHAQLVRDMVFEGMSDPELRAVRRWTGRVSARLTTSPTPRT